MTRQSKSFGLRLSTDLLYSQSSLDHINELLERLDGLSQPRQLGNHLVVVPAQPACITTRLLSDCISSSAWSSSPRSTHFSGSKLYSWRLKSGMEIFLEAGCTEKGSLSRWFCMVETWQSILGQRKDSMISSSMKVSLCTFDSGSLPAAQSATVLAHSNLRISSPMMPSMASALLFLLRVHSSFTLSRNFSCLVPTIFSISSMHLACSNAFCSTIMSRKCLPRIQMLLSTCALAYCFRQNRFTYSRLSFPLIFDFQPMLFSTYDTTFSASSDSAFTLPVTSYKQSTSPFLTESFSSLARLSQTQMCSPRPPEKTNMSWLKPKSSESAFSMTSTAMMSSFQHLTHTRLPEQQVRTSSQSFMSKSKMSSLSKVLPLVSFSGTRFQMAPASTFLGMVEWRSIMRLFIASASTKVTQRSTPPASYSKESSRWASSVLWLCVSQRTMVLKGQRQLQQTLSSYSAIWREIIIINEPNHAQSRISAEQLGMRVQEHLYQLAVLEEQDVGRSADQGVQASLLDGEANAHSVQGLCLHFLQNVPDHLAVDLFSTLGKSYSGSLAFMKSGWIYILADSQGAYESCLELKRKMCRKCFIPSNLEMRQRQVSLGLGLSAMVSCLRQLLFLNFCSTQMPASMTEEVLTLQPRCGEEKVRREWNLCFMSISRGRAALMITPPRLCPMKERCWSESGGKNSFMWFLISTARRFPISMMSVSVMSSFELAHRKETSGYMREKLFLMSFMSSELPWKPCTRMAKCSEILNRLQDQLWAVSGFGEQVSSIMRLRFLRLLMRSSLTTFDQNQSLLLYSISYAQYFSWMPSMSYGATQWSEMAIVCDLLNLSHSFCCPRTCRSSRWAEANLGLILMRSMQWCHSLSSSPEMRLVSLSMFSMISLMFLLLYLLQIFSSSLEFLLLMKSYSKRLSWLGWTRMFACSCLCSSVITLLNSTLYSFSRHQYCLFMRLTTISSTVLARAIFSHLRESEADSAKLACLGWIFWFFSSSFFFSAWLILLNSNSCRRQARKRQSRQIECTDTLATLKYCPSQTTGMNSWIPPLLFLSRYRLVLGFLPFSMVISSGSIFLTCWSQNMRLASSTNSSSCSAMSVSTRKCAMSFSCTSSSQYRSRKDLVRKDEDSAWTKASLMICGSPVLRSSSLP